MNYSKNEIKAGAFIVCCGVLLVVFLVAITGLDFKSDTVQYRVRFTYIGGISEGSLVRYGGMEVGHVVDIRVPEDTDARIELILEVAKETPIKNDSEAFLTTIGFMGANYVEITLGSASSGRLPENALLTSADITPLSQMGNSAGQVAARLEVFLDRLNDMLNEENRETFSAVLQNTNKILSREDGDITLLVNNLSELFTQLKGTLASIDTIIVANESVLEKGIEEVPAVLERTKVVLENLEATTRHLDRMITVNSENYSEIIQHMQRTAENLEAFTQSIKERPWLLVRKAAPEVRK